MSDLRTVIATHAARLAEAVIASLKELSIDDLIRLGQGEAAAPTPARAPRNAKKMPSGRLARRTLADIDATLDQIVALLKTRPGLRSEQIGAALGLDKKELPRPLAEGLARGVLSKAGARRGTTYYAEKRG